MQLLMRKAKLKEEKKHEDAHIKKIFNGGLERSLKLPAAEA
jgi:hypothetical protein